MLSTLLRKARNFARRPLFEQAWFLPAWLLLGTSRLLILIIPFRTLAQRLGTHTGVEPWVPLINEHQEFTARRIARVVQMTAKYTPWLSNCFPQAVAARILLGIYGIPCSIFFGVARKPGNTQMQAHAWVASGRITVSGGRSFDHYTVVGCFVAPGLPLPCEQLGERSEDASGTVKKGT